MAAAPLTIGPYQVVRELGRGGMGVVYEGRDPLAGRRVALKVLLEVGLDVDALARFEREARLLARVKHPGVVVVHALERSGRSPVLVTELIEGARELERGPLPPREAARIVREVASALEAVHAAGVLHRDLKPGNVLRRADGSLVLLDFGVARELDGSSLTRTGDVVGTPAFMAPEQVEGRRDLDARADVYGLGALLYVLLVGAPPFVGGVVQVSAAILQRDPPWPRERVGAPEGLDAIVRRAMAKAPEDRPASAAALGEELERWLAAPGAERPTRRPLAATGAAIVAVAVTAFGVWFARRPAPVPPSVLEPSAPAVDAAPEPDGVAATPELTARDRLAALLAEPRAGALGADQRGTLLFDERVPDAMYTRDRPLLAKFLDARRLAVGVAGATRAGTALVTADGVAWTALPDAGVGPITRVAAVGGRVAVAGTHGIAVLGPEPANPRRRLADTRVTEMVAAGKRLLFSDGQRIWFVDVDGGDPSLVCDLGSSSERKDLDLALSSDATAGIVLETTASWSPTHFFRLRLPGPSGLDIEAARMELPSGTLNRRSAAISSDGRLALGGDAFSLEVWTEGSDSTTPLDDDPEDRRKLPALRYVAFSPRGRFVYAVSSSSKPHVENAVVIWEPGGGSRRVPRPHGMSSVAVSSDGLLLAIGTEQEGRLEVWVAGDDLP